MPTTDLRALADALGDQALPAFVVDLAAFDENVRRVAGYAAQGRRGLTVRVATKSLRVPALIRRVLDAGPPFAGLMCFCPAEAKLLHEQGFDDLLVAYPVTRASDLAIIRELHDRGADLKVMVDCRAHLDLLAPAMAGAARPLPVVVDLDASLHSFGMHLGVRRSGVRGPKDALALFEACPDGLVPVGVMAYEAQVAGLPDASPHTRSKNVPIRAVRKMSVRAVRGRRRRVHDALVGAGFPLELFNGGGSGSLDTTPHDESVTEATAGSAFYCPRLFDHFQHVSFVPAAYLALAVVRSSDPGYVTCAGGGYLASGPPGPDRVPQPVWPPGLALLPDEGAGEVQTPLACSREVPALGSAVLFRHPKAGEVTERFAEAVLVEDGAVIDRVPTYRGLGARFT